MILPQAQRKLERGLTRPFGVGEGGLGKISPSLDVLLFRPIFQNLRKSLTIFTEFSYFYFFKLCGIAALRSEDDKK
jgi:hypothetical protein